MNCQLLQASAAEFRIIKNLIPYYVYDFSEHMGWDCNAEGRYDGCDELPDYWEKPRHCPYLILADSKIAGFALARPYPAEPERMEVGEFFVLRKFRRQGVGKTAAIQLFDAHPGKWLVRVLRGNTPAERFWEKVTGEYSRGCVARTEEIFEGLFSGKHDMIFLRFDNARP